METPLAIDNGGKACALCYLIGMVCCSHVRRSNLIQSTLCQKSGYLQGMPDARRGGLQPAFPAALVGRSSGNAPRSCMPGALPAVVYLRLSSPLPTATVTL